MRVFLLAEIGIQLEADGWICNAIEGFKPSNLGRSILTDGQGDVFQSREAARAAFEIGERSASCKIIANY